MKHLEPLPSFNITPILEHLGMEQVPTGRGWVKCRCYGHTDRTPSAAVNHDVNGYRCFSCERAGDGLRLLQDELGLTFRDALTLARELTGDEQSHESRTEREPATAWLI